MEYNLKRVHYAQYLKKQLETKCKIVHGDFREQEFKGSDIVFTLNAAASSLGKHDADILIDIILNGSDLILMQGYYGKDDDIFKILDNHPSVETSILWKLQSEVIHYSKIDWEKLSISRNLSIEIQIFYNLEKVQS